MQLYAQDQTLSIVYAKNALKNCDYRCLECQSLVRLRGGIHRQNHFYHVYQNRSCRQNGKSMEHLQVQIYLQNSLGKECVLEKRFDEIGRIADVVWLLEKIIFEVQCSPISLEEVKLRNKDYESLGFKVIWILHDKRFNKYRVKAAEVYLQPLYHYFTNIDAAGMGIIYDQFHLFDLGKRTFASKQFCIDMTKMVKNADCQLLKERSFFIPELLFNRIHSHALFFKGDLIDYCKSEVFEKETFVHAIQLINSKKPKKLKLSQKIVICFNKWIVRPYKIIFRVLLEKATL